MYCSLEVNNKLLLDVNVKHIVYPMQILNVYVL